MKIGRTFINYVEIRGTFINFVEIGGNLICIIGLRGDGHPWLPLPQPITATSNTMTKKKSVIIVQMASLAIIKLSLKIALHGRCCYQWGKRALTGTNWETIVSNLVASSNRIVNYLLVEDGPRTSGTDRYALQGLLMALQSSISANKDLHSFDPRLAKEVWADLKPWKRRRVLQWSWYPHVKKCL